MVLRGEKCGRALAGVITLALPFLPFANPGAARAAFLPYNMTGAASPTSGPGAGNTRGGETSGEKDGKDNSRESKRRHLHCGPFGDGCGERQNAVREGQEARDRAHRRHGHRAGDWGSGSRTGCVAQGGCSSYTGSGYRNVASGLRGSASDLLSQAAQLQQQQKKVSDYSYNYNPGPSEPEAQKFREANQSGQTRVTGFSSEHPMVQDQASQYDEMGRLANELEEEAKKLQDQAREMDQLAQRAETNADHLESRTDPGGRAGEKFGEGGTDHPNGYMQTDPSAKLARGALANQNTSKPGDLAAPDDKLSSPLHPGSGITAGANANYPTRAADNLSAITGGAGTGVRAGSAGSSLREQLKARLKEQYGREPSASEVEQAVARAAGAVTGTEGAAGAGKPDPARSTAAAVPSEDPAAAFNKGLGTGSLEIAGSETEASVAAMMRELAVAEAAQNRAPASVQSADVGAEEGPTLFERAHATHRRCEQRGCVNWRVAAVRGGG